VIRAPTALLGLALVLLPLASLAQPAGAATSVRIDLVATEVDGVPTFTDASGAPNPTLHALPGSRVTIHLANHGTMRHNVLLGAPVGVSMPCCLAPGAEADLTVDLPAGFEGDIRYECGLHGAGGMGGTLRVGTPPPSVRILAPLNGTTVHGEAIARVEVGNATLGQGYALRYLLDGVALPNATGATVPLGKLARGNHIVQVELVNATGESLPSPAKAEVIFFEDPDAVATPPNVTDATPTTPTAPPAASPSPRTPAPAAALALVGIACAAALLRRWR
jgi:hypothetical protein